MGSDPPGTQSGDEHAAQCRGQSGAHKQSSDRPTARQECAETAAGTTW
jgi:hypothetical protein